MKVGVISCELGARLHVQASTVVSDQNLHPLEVHFVCISSGQTPESAEHFSNSTDAPHTSSPGAHQGTKTVNADILNHLRVHAVAAHVS